MFRYDRDIFIHSLGLWLDARRKKAFSFVSHAHGDHTGAHDRILATPATLALASERACIRREILGLRSPRRAPGEMPVEFGEKIELDGATVTLYPAGHILGSAQILIEHDGGSLLYSGDFCPENAAAAEGIEIPHAETLIMECTYGLPEHKFPPRKKVIEDLYKFIDKTLAEDRTPMVFCYALGKGQEVAHLLGMKGYRVAAERETWRLAKVYERFGVEFGDLRCLDSPVQPGEVMVIPSWPQATPYLDGRRVRTAAATGWVTGGFYSRTARTDARIALSDHADFPGLLKYIEAVAPKTVYIVHGPSEFAYYVKKAGFEVRPITEKQASRVL